MKSTLFALAVTGVLVAGVSLPASAADILKSKGCLGCHAMDKKKVGPAIKDIASKYKGNKSAESELVAKLKSGKGHMKVKGSDDDIQAAVREMLGAR